MLRRTHSIAVSTRQCRVLDSAGEYAAQARRHTATLLLLKGALTSSMVRLGFALQPSTESVRMGHSQAAQHSQEKEGAAQHRWAYRSASYESH
jgi:hypothetical protein